MIKNKKIKIAVLIIIAISSFIFSFFASKPSFYESTIAILDENKADAIALSSTATAVAIGVSTIEICEPIAEMLTQIASYTVLITTVIFLEKFMLTTIGSLTFSLLIPIACILGIIFQISNKYYFKTIAIKIAVFGVLLAITIPTSAWLGVQIENTHKNSFEVIEDIQTEEEIKDKGFWNKFKNKTNEAKEYAETKLNHFIDSIAVMLITTCAIPIGVLAFMLWLVKIIFGININLPNPTKITEKVSNEKKQAEITTV